MCQRITVPSWFVTCVAILWGSSCLCDRLYGQAGLRESLERLDTNGDGMIAPDEITPQARPYLERVAKVRRMSLDGRNKIDKLQEAARIYYALKNGVAGKEVDPEAESTVKPFEPDADQPLVPDFGLGDVKYAYIQADLDEADRTIRRNDRNRDGYIDRAEAARAHWTHRNPFETDLNKDDRLSRMELCQRYARRRLLSGASDELIQKARRAGNGIRPSTRERERERERGDSQWWRRKGSNYWLTASVLGRFDTNRNGQLEEEEAQKLGFPTTRIDIDLDGVLSRDELQVFILERQNEAGAPLEGLPGWFYELDVDRDEQVAMSEFETDWTNEKLQEFRSLDANSDGYLTTREVAESMAMMGGSYRNEKAEVLPPGKTIISEIEVSDDYLIRDLNVQLSITHTSDRFLDAYLTGPDGQRIELFTEVGGSDDHFDQTVFDDQSEVPITKARPPFKGSFKPEGLGKRQPSLSHFNGKNVQGVWQLIVRGTRSDRFGMLHSWALLVKPQEELLGQTAANPLPGSSQSDASRASSPPQEPVP